MVPSIVVAFPCDNPDLILCRTCGSIHVADDPCDPSGGAASSKTEDLVCAVAVPIDESIATAIWSFAAATHPDTYPSLALVPPPTFTSARAQRGQPDRPILANLL